MTELQAMPPATTATLSKGVIVCDVSGLMPLMAPLPLSCLKPELREAYLRDPEKPLPSLFDALVFLARKGYPVVIPEMVAYKMGNHLREGKNTDDLFDHKQPPRDVAAFVQYRAFFKEIHQLNEKGVPIYVVSPFDDNHSKDAATLLDLYKCCKNGKADYGVAHLKRTKVMALQKRFAGSGHTTEDEIKQYIRSADNPYTQAQVPMFLLTNNYRLQNAFTHRKDVRILGALGFFHAMRDAGLLDLAGFEGLDESVFLHHLNAHLANHTIYHPASYHERPGSDFIAHESPFSHRGPFAAAMRTFKNELMGIVETPDVIDAGKTPAPVAVLPEAEKMETVEEDQEREIKPVPTQVEKFHQRYGAGPSYTPPLKEPKSQWKTPRTTVGTDGAVTLAPDLRDALYSKFGEPLRQGRN